MRTTALPALFLLSLFGAIGPALEARAARFTVVDEKAQEEIEETTRLFIDGTMIANFTLDAGHLRKDVKVNVPDRPGRTDHDYVLCGEIAFHTADGSKRIRRVSGQGSLPAPDGRTFIAVGGEDFTMVYLVDPGDRMAVRPEAGLSPFCQAPVS